MLRLHFLFVFLVGTLPLAFGDQKEYQFKVSKKAGDLLAYYCYECHDSGLQKGDVRLDDLESLAQGERLDLLNVALEHVFSGEMPPKKADQPTRKERDDLAAWIWSELKIFNASKLEDKLRYYKYANYLDHDRLFNGAIAEKPFTRARRWRINELIYLEKVNDVFELAGRGRKPSFFGVVKPFNLPTDPGVAYYDTETVEGGQFLTLLSNAQWIVDKQLRAALLKSGDFVYSDEYHEAKKNGRGFRARFPDEVWNPGRTAEPFEQVVQAAKPTESSWRAAINHQFKVALQREPSPEEISRYLGLIATTLKTSDKTGALKNVMTSILMEPEFLYRREFGAGTPDAAGRVRLTSREASYAIAYALTDRIPGPALVAAAEADKLRNGDDYEREVRRILQDSDIAKPRILRFFQDYFGYMGVYDVFKDEERFVGAYNPHRVVSTKYVYRVPGKLRKEADTLVEWILERDQNVLETLLTTERFFVHHNGDNEEMKKKARKATEEAVQDRRIYQKTKGLKRDELSDYLKSINQYVTGSGKIARRFHIDTDEWKLRFGPDGKQNRGIVPMPPDSEGVIHSVKMWNLDHLTWSYEPEQPTKIANRTGMLTHPAWLVANSQNAATDPIHRGKWIREKLLGGFIRDVPITVDAKVPEDPHRTLRERFAVSEAKNCWQCHEKMNPLGYVFEEFDDFGRYRRQEELEYPENIVKTETIRAKGEHGVFKNYRVPTYKTKAVDSSGFLEGSGNKGLDGPVENVHDLMTRLGKSERVRQVFVRNVFRYFMGRNETFADSKTLIEAEKAYLESGGSFQELMVSLLTSDSFIYRKSS